MKLRRRVAGALLLLAAGLAGGCAFPEGFGSRAYPEPVPLTSAGLVGDPAGGLYPVPPDEAKGASYLPESSVLRFSDGSLFYVPPGSSRPVVVPSEDRGAAASASGSRAWLERGEVPGRTSLERGISSRSLLDLRLLARPGGAVLAGPNAGWDHVWPRDASFASAAFAATGHGEEARSALLFLARAERPDGTWAARYRPDGEPVLDGRQDQLDATGWFAWAVWFCAAESPDGARSVRSLWPAVKRSADAATASLGPEGLPPGGADYWEMPTLLPNLETSAALLAGLWASADLAEDLGHPADAARYRAAARLLGAAVKARFAPNGYTRTPQPFSGRDAAVVFLAPPFAPYEPSVRRAALRTEGSLRTPNGGLLPGEGWPEEPTVSWTPETSFFALFKAASGEKDRTELRWLEAHRTGLGAFPEKVSGSGEPKAAAPLAWTDALVLLTLAAGEKPLPIPPAR